MAKRNTQPQIRVRRVEELVPYSRNARTHSEEQIQKVARSIEEFGFTNPILVDKDDTVIAGHARLEAAKSLGMTEVPTIVLEHLSPEQVKAYCLADNALALDAGWDEEILRMELSDLAMDDFDLSVIGFDDNEIRRLLEPDEEYEGTPAPEPPEDPVTKTGDLWLLGGHRLLCGDSGNPDDVDRLLGGAPIHLVNTDPPYNVRVEPRSNNAISAGLSSFSAAKKTHHQGLDLAKHPGKAKATTKKMRPKDRPLENDFVTDEQFAKMLRAWFGNASRVLLPGRGFYIWGGYANCGNYPPVLKECQLYFSQAIIWDKEHPVLTRKDFMGAHEWCFYGWKEGAAHKWYGPTNATDLWHVKKINPQSMIHLTEKPVELAKLAIQYSSRRGENVLDLFGGSGSTLIAAEQTSRHAFLMETDAPYCDVIIQRWQEHTGDLATLDGTKKTFNEITAEGRK